jgi:hypothetical protein
MAVFEMRAARIQKFITRSAAAISRFLSLNQVQ